MFKTILITGVSNGLGRAFGEVYVLDPNTHVIGIDRTAPPEHLRERGNFTFHRADITDQDAIDRIALSLEADETALNLIVHSAGIRGLVPKCVVENKGDVPACENLAVMNVSTLEQTFSVNVVGTFLLLRAMMPSLQRAEASGTAKVIVMSSRMGSVGNNARDRPNAGGAYAYRASKAALNTLVRSMAVDVPSVAFVLCHPGRVETALVDWREEGAITAEESVKDLLPLIDGWTLADSGKLYDRFGEIIEW